MNLTRLITALLLLFILAALVLCFGPWYETRTASVLNSLFKLIGILVAAVASFLVFSRLAGADHPQRRPWLLLALGLLLYSGGQGVLAFYQIVLDVRIPFPSAGDPLFVLACPPIIIALFLFCRISYRSGLPLGSPLLFWSPALAVAAIFTAGAYPLLAPILRAGDPPLQTFLNVFYPAASFVALAPCLVMLRVGLKFRGGRLLAVWLPLSLGFTAVLLSDILFAYLVSANIPWIEHLVDFLYVAGYALIPLGALSQANLLR